MLTMNLEGPVTEAVIVDPLGEDIYLEGAFAN